MSELAIPTGEVAPSARRRGKNVYFADGFYSMHSDKGLEEFGLSASLKPDFRIFLLASARSNRWGHCPFGQGELLALLGVSLNTMKKGIDSLVKAGITSPDSTPMCIVLSGRVIRRADRSDRCCSEPKHFNRQRRMWIHGSGWGWEPKEGFWQDALNDTVKRQGIAAEFTRTTTTTVTETVRLSAS